MNKFSGFEMNEDDHLDYGSDIEPSIPHLMTRKEYDDWIAESDDLKWTLMARSNHLKESTIYTTNEVGSWDKMLVEIGKDHL